MPSLEFVGARDQDGCLFLEGITFRPISWTRADYFDILRSFWLSVRTVRHSLSYFSFLLSFLIVLDSVQRDIRTQRPLPSARDCLTLKFVFVYCKLRYSLSLLFFSALWSRNSQCGSCCQFWMEIHQMGSRQWLLFLRSGSEHCSLIRYFFVLYEFNSI